MESLIFLNKKRDETIKSRIFANGSTQRVYISRKEATSLNSASEDIVTTGVIGVRQKRNPNVFVQT